MCCPPLYGIGVHLTRYKDFIKFEYKELNGSIISNIRQQQKYIGLHCPKIFKIVRLHINLKALIEKENIQIGVRQM